MSSYFGKDRLPTTDVHLDVQTLKIMEIGIHHVMTDMNFQGYFKLDAFHEHGLRMGAKLRAYLAGKEHKTEYQDKPRKEVETKTHTFKAPARLWDYIKLEWFPAWALRRWPATMREEVFEFSYTTRIYHTTYQTVTKMCPHLAVPEGEMRHVNFCVMNTPSTEVKE